MILVIKKNNISLVILVFLLSLAIYSLNIGVAEVENNVVPATVASNEQRTVIIDAGHGGEDPGAVSDYSGQTEKEINLKLALAVRELLENDGYNVILTRSEDVLVYEPGSTSSVTQKRKQDLLRRKKIMDESGADIVVSIHLNKFDQTKYYGAQVFFPPDSADSMKLAMNLQKSLKENVDSNNTREALLKKDPIIILKNLKTPTAIVECGFLSNQEEEARLITNEYQTLLSIAIKQGIDDFYANK